MTEQARYIARDRVSARFLEIACNLSSYLPRAVKFRLYGKLVSEITQLVESDDPEPSSIASALAIKIFEESSDESDGLEVCKLALASMVLERAPVLINSADHIVMTNPDRDRKRVEHDNRQAANFSLTVVECYLNNLLRDNDFPEVNRGIIGGMLLAATNYRKQTANLLRLEA